MTTPGDEQHVTPAGQPNDEPTLERILRNMGPREMPTAPGMQEVRAAVEAEWRSVVQSRRTRTRRRAWPVAAGIAAAAILAFAYSLWAMAGAGAETIYWGFLLLIAGLPVYVFLVRRSSG